MSTTVAVLLAVILGVSAGALLLLLPAMVLRWLLNVTAPAPAGRRRVPEDRSNVVRSNVVRLGPGVLASRGKS
jgi:hypothetical protein